MTIHETLQAIDSGAFDASLIALYACEDCTPCRTRLRNAVLHFQTAFHSGDDTEIRLFSVPARTELGGNHTDHQGGHALAAAITLDLLAVAAEQDFPEIQIFSEEFEQENCSVSLSALHPFEQERFSCAALFRGVATKCIQDGCAVGGLQIYITSDIPPESGLSSSAAMEILAGLVYSSFYAETPFSPLQLAEIGKFAENVFFGKPCGLLDQLICSIGGMLALNFQPNIPEWKQIPFDAEKFGYALCFLDASTAHSDTSQAYAAIPQEMNTIAKMFSREKLSEISETEFFSHFAGLRRTCGDRAVLRAMHYFEEEKRVIRQVQFLENEQFPEFLQEVNASGLSSSACLQNLSFPSEPEHQGAATAIALCQRLLDGRGAVRVHGGGFSGTVQAYVPVDFLSAFKMQMENWIGIDRCRVLHLRKIGATQLIIKK